MTRVAALPLQVFAVPVQLPGVSEVLHQGLHQACGREEVIALVAIVIATQAAGPPGVDRGQLRERGTTLERQPSTRPQLPFTPEMVFINNAPQGKNKYESNKPQLSPRCRRRDGANCSISLPPAMSPLPHPGQRPVVPHRIWEILWAFKDGDSEFQRRKGTCPRSQRSWQSRDSGQVSPGPV